MTATTADLRTLAQIRAGIRHRAEGMGDAHVARKAESTAAYVIKLRNDTDVNARIEAAVIADEWAALAMERAIQGRRAAA
ncbi:hypothetical protein ACFRCG_39680 [Embleya sp. NPDC056575]|uniref:hypothetical protein n=1 Tax=unclassified Embleya TaxID=2699296 RepID=UPI0036CB589C